MKNILSSFRDKNGPPSRNRSLREDKPKRHFPTEFFRLLPTQTGYATAREISEIEETQKLLERINITGVSAEHIRDVLAAPYAEGDVVKAAEFIDIEQKSSAGIIVPYDPNVHMLGAVNRSYSTCYLDTLLFSMFAKLEAFECMLKTEFPVDLFHQGKSEEDDHKVVYERLLNLAVPSDPERTSIRLEDCLEEYFNAQIDVSRMSEVGPKTIPEGQVGITRRNPRSNSEVALNFDQKPVVGICLKRYSMDAQGIPQRNGTYIDIPDSLRLPHFMLAGGPDVGDDPSGLESGYKLVLQSVICHRGESVHSGHYIAFARVAPRLLVDNRRHEFDPPPDYEEAQWVRFDDMNGNARVTPVADEISVALQTETPYLIFYQVVPRRDEPCPVAEPELPPSYDELRTSIDAEYFRSSQSYPTTPRLFPKDGNDEPGFRDISSLWVKVKSPGIRLSTDVDFAQRRAQDGQAGGSGNDAVASRRQSVSFSDSGRSGATPILTPEGHSPIIAPEDEPMGTASRLSRAASRFTLMQSRAVSSSGENRLTNTMSRLGLYRSSREALAEPGSSSSSRRISTGEAASSDVDGRKSTSSELPPDDKDKSSQDSTHLTPTPKTKHKRNKSRDKGDKKSESPDRECSIM
ncbi:hypothetical protein ESCO_000398 [Escovopsis weberi]|uniref:ubiquitinyl hydrolase 1 n=1 Tax=Escovopsis weberi TaxID=150374 RepID=A0A0M8MVG0_ESCWE|nr:hypothetical protein ESCO_000398 [Escovopsis weberi]